MADIKDLKDLKDQKDQKDQNVVRKTLLTKSGATVTVYSAGSFHEVQVVEPDAKSGVKHLDIIMRDSSGSMWDATNNDGSPIQNINDPRHHVTGAIGILNGELQKIVNQAVKDEHDVAIVSWAQDSSYHFVDAKNQATILKDSCDVAKIGKSQSEAKNANEFTHPKWWESTCPRRGFDRVIEILKLVRPSGVTIWFGTDGSFIKPPVREEKTHALSDEFLQQLQVFLVDYNVPIKMVYVGIDRDQTVDARRIMSVFPICDYMFARTKTDLPSLDMLSKMQTQAVYDRVLTVQDGVKKVLIVENYARVGCKALEFPDAKLIAETSILMPYLGMRSEIYDIIVMLNSIEQKRAAGQKIYEDLMRVDMTLKTLEVTIGKIKVDRASERQTTREYLFTAQRVKNLLQQYAAQEVSQDAKGDGGRQLLAQNQEFKMAQGDKFSIAIAKRITQNKANKRPWESSLLVEKKDKTVTFTTKVQFTDNNQVAVYKTEDVPAAVAADEAIDFLSVDSWADVYLAGSCKTQCILISSRPSEIVFHSPSRTRLAMSNSQVSLNTVLDSIEQRVSVEGFDSLFTKPFTGSTAVDLYTAGLPTWSPNLNFVSRYRLRSLVGYLLGGHDLAYPGRWVDIYIPAILSGWLQFFNTGSEATLENTMLLQIAFQNIKEWTKTGNMYDQKAVTAVDTLKVWAAGNEGTHAFMNVYEPMLYAMMVPKEVSRTKLQNVLTAQLVYQSAKAADTLWSDYVKPLAREVIRELGVLDKKDFDPKATFMDQKNGIPVTDAMRVTVDKYLNKSKSLLDVLKNMLRMHALFEKTPEVWAETQRDYKLPAKFADAARNALKMEIKDVDTQEVIGMIAIANEYPSNATRRDMKHTGIEVFDQKCRAVFLEEAGELRKAKYYEGRLADCQRTHSGFPIILDHYGALLFKNAKRYRVGGFEHEFRKHFAAHVDMERAVFGDQKEFDKLLSANLAKFHAAADGLDVEITVTNLPKYRCGCVLCPQFMQYDRQLDSHLSIFGGDLRAGHECRMWVPNMHIHMAGLDKKMGRDKFVDAMSQYTLQYVNKVHIKRFEKYFAWVFDKK